MHIMNFQIKLQKLPIALTSLLREVSDRLFVTAVPCPKSSMTWGGLSMAHGDTERPSPNIGEGRFSCVPIWLRASASF